jgi:hypothetical protein
MPSKFITVSGQVKGVAKEDATRLSAFIVICDQVLAQGPIQADGRYRLNLSLDAATAKSAYALQLAVAPTSAANHLAKLPQVQRVAIKRDALGKEDTYKGPTIEISKEALRLWWTWCRIYCVSGTVAGPDNCAAPGAEVTVYTVTWTGSGYTKIPRGTVTTAPDGTFTACFDWCTCAFCFPCWPCWPIWWDCWPWWWEWDILRVIEAIERQPVIVGPGPVESFANQAALIRPEARALMRGQGFQPARLEAFAPNVARTALIKAKLSDARIRALFPWWWWCCDDPNIIFSVTQNGNLIVNENPATDTRWCLEDGSNVTLVGNASTSTICSPGCPPETGFVWTNVGNVEVADISLGYAYPAAAGDNRDLAFAGSLELFGMLAPGLVSYYQVYGAQWTGNAARGGVAPSPGSGAPVAAPLDRVVYIYNADFTFNSSHTVRMGPFSQGGLVNLYATQEARQTGPTPPGLLPFPAVPAGGSVYWDKLGLMLRSGSSNLIGGATTGSVDLTVIGYDGALNPVALTPDDPLTLTIDNTPLTTSHVNGVSAWRSPGVPAVQTGTGDCPAYDVGPTGFVLIDVTVSDSEGHLFEYYVNAEYGHGHEAPVTPPGVRGYVTNPLVSGGDPNYAQKSWVGGNEVMTFPASTPGVSSPPPDCCYEFRLRVGKRVTDGYHFPSLGDSDFQTISLKFSS